MSLLQAKDINQYYGGSHILRNVSLQAELGEIEEEWLRKAE